ncbi:MAG: histidine phosphatase family protein [Candidatus Rokubacteria bacterium]|nr:histidine phosphatase family protein [Candidatus Rokubacteria bacterium]
MRLLLARHGESVWNGIRRFQGATDVPLSEVGYDQARALGRALRTYRVAAAYVSPLERARATALTALGDTGVPLTPVDELREFGLGEWEGRTIDEIRRRDGNPYRAWVRAPLDSPPPGAEPLDQVGRRVIRAFERIAAAHPNGDDVLVVAHGGVISVYACHVLGCSLNALWRLRIDNASLTVVTPPRLLTLNDTFHLEGASVEIPERPSGGLAAAIDVLGGGVGRGAKPPSETR